MRKTISVLVLKEGHILARLVEEGESEFAGMLTLPTEYWSENLRGEICAEMILYKDSSALVRSIKSFEKLLEVEGSVLAYLYFAELVNLDKPLREDLKFVTLEEFTESLAEHNYPLALDILFAIKSKL